MTKQHFQAFADEIKYSQEPIDIRIKLAETVANVAKRFNGRFDRDRFFRACNLHSMQSGQ
jgi:hypothetical protein